MLRISGENPFFTIDNKGYCGYISIQTVDDALDYQIKVCHKNESKEHSISNIYKDVSVLEIKDDLSEVNFVPILLDENNDSFSIESISIQNRLIINYYRIFVLISILILISVLLFFRKELCMKLHVVFLLIIVMLGINISIINPVYYSFDEREHFVRAYELSYLQLGLGEEKKIPWIEKSDDFLYRADYTRLAHQNIVERNNYIEKYSSTDYTNQKLYDSTAATYLFVPYIPGAIGIALGRFFQLPFVWTFYLGRIVSLLGYGVICAWCIKHVKYGKRLFFMVGLLPALLFVATAYSADTYTLAFSFVALTIWLDILIQKEDIKFIQIIGFVSAVLVVTMCKVAYVPLCLLFLVIPCNKFSSRLKSIVTKLMVILSSAAFSLVVYLYSNMKDMNQWNIIGVDVSEQIKYIIWHPVNYLFIVINDIFMNFITYITGITSYLAYNKSLQPIWTIALFVLLCVVAMLDNESDRLALSWKDRVGLSLGSICSWGLVATALYVTFTPVASDTIQGIQGRYLAPLIVPILLLVKNKKISCDIKREIFNYILIWCMVVPLIFTLWSILSNCCG